MNKQGQINVQMMMGIFITILVALVLIVPIAQYVGSTTYTESAVNTTYTAGAEGVAVDLAGQELLNTPVVTNASDGTLVDSNNYTIDEGVSATTGLKTIRYTSAAGSWNQNQTVNITYQYGDDGYIESSGGRSIASLIVLFSCLAVGVVALWPTLKSGLERMG